MKRYVSAILMLILLPVLFAMTVYLVCTDKDLSETLCGPLSD